MKKPRKCIEIIERLRADGVVCCLHLKSDYDYCWWIEWSYSEIYPQKSDHHQKHHTKNYDDLIDALLEADREINS